MGTFSRLVLTFGLVAALAGVGPRATARPRRVRRGRLRLPHPERGRPERTEDGQGAGGQGDRGRQEGPEKHADEFTKLRDLSRGGTADEVPGADEDGQRGNADGRRRGTEARAADPPEADWNCSAPASWPTPAPTSSRPSKLSDEQKEKVKTISEEANKQIRELERAQAARGHRAGRAGPAGTGGRGSGPTPRS